MVGHDNLAAAHTPSAATLCWQGLGMAKRCPVNSGSIIWTSGLRVSPHCRHACGPSLIFHHASLPCKGERHACDSISSKPCASHQRNHACGAPLLCMSHCVAKVLQTSNLAFLFEGSGFLPHSCGQRKPLPINSVNSMCTRDTVIIPIRD